ncbi:hypothetical protein [Oleisolibacter albus]|uniref:AbiU2 domain-containing protein n=1 Tax=Oleisolibacter albus TaxID=2171757 RepID=UPI0012D82BA0|nr:hypothetical protein [Oleisolibacter albus]
MKKDIQPLQVNEAKQRSQQIFPILFDDIWIMLLSLTLVEAANDLLLKTRFQQPSEYEDTIKVVINTLLISSVLNVSRIFDVNPNKTYDSQDKASIPVLMYLLERPDVRNAVAVDSCAPRERALSGLDTMLGIYKDAKEKKQFQDAHHRIKAFRNHRLAHHLFEKSQDNPPLISDIFLLATVARPIAEQIYIIKYGEVRELLTEEAIIKQTDTAFWTKAFSAALCTDTDVEVPDTMCGS